MKPDGTLLLKRDEISALLTIEECMAAVEQAFKLYAEGKTTAPGVLGIPARDGGFHTPSTGGCSHNSNRT